MKTYGDGNVDLDYEFAFKRIKLTGLSSLNGDFDLAERMDSLLRQFFVWNNNYD